MIRALCILALLLVCVACVEAGIVTPRMGLSHSEADAARERLEGLWEGRLQSTDKARIFQIHFEKQVLHMRLDGVETTAVAWTPTWVSPTEVVVVSVHPDGLHESVLRFETDETFFLDELPRVHFERAAPDLSFTRPTAP